MDGLYNTLEHGGTMPKIIKRGRRISTHILATSSNLLGICFILISFLKFFKVDKTISHFIDKLIVIPILLFLTACIFSYGSMRNRKKEIIYEKTADIIFLSALIVMTAISLMISFEIL